MKKHHFFIVILEILFEDVFFYPFPFIQSKLLVLVLIKATSSFKCELRAGGRGGARAGHWFTPDFVEN